MTDTISRSSRWFDLRLYDLLLLIVLLIAAYFRTVGLNWDEYQHLHPDERFLTMVESALQVKKCAIPNTPLEACPPQQQRGLSLSDYFDTAISPLNPHNRGYGFFVYGDFPIFLVRYVAEWLGQVGYDEVHLVGRQVSVLSDLLTILLLYITAARLYDRRVALLGAAFSALAVLQIQQAHFFTVDTMANLFMFLALYFATAILLTPPSTAKTSASQPSDSSLRGRLLLLIHDPLLRLSVALGLALGLAISSKLNAVPLILLLPAALVLRNAVHEGGQPLRHLSPWAIERLLPPLVLGALVTALAFRIFMPYAFRGLGLNPAWIANIKELAAQTGGDVDVPFALQWARRSPLFAFKNLTLWGLGLPLGILAWAGFLTMGWRILRGEWKHLLLWGWTAFYFTWQSLVFNPSMRYQLPVYPLLAMMGAWLVIWLWDGGRRTASRATLPSPLALLSLFLGLTVLLLSAAWAFAFTRIYTRPVTRVAATRWIYQHVPGPINVRIRTADGSIYQQPLPFPAGGQIRSGVPYELSFRANAGGSLSEVYLPHIAAVEATGPQTLRLSLALQPEAPPEQILGMALLTSDFGPGADGRGGEARLLLDRPLLLNKGQTYFLRFETGGALTLSGAAPINESDWDDGLPLRLGAEGYDGYGGLYQGGLNLQIYWDDTPDKLQRFVDTLTQGDYIFISSNRQWASVTRLPERYPLTTAYYRALLGCPDDKDVIWCYNVARPGRFEGRLGYDLVAVFESFPSLEFPSGLKWEVNDQFAEEAFTVYDHPKVLIFQKRPDFNPERVRALLGAVDLSNVVHLTPKQASRYKSLMLSEARLAEQRAGGTWSEMFNYAWLQNRYPVLGLLLWYAFLFLLGLAAYPPLRLVLPGLKDRGYPLARLFGLALLGYFSWLVGSLGLPLTRLSLAAVTILLAAAGLGLGWRQRREIKEAWRTRRSEFLVAEALFFLFFLFDLLIRLGNPDLWHPAKGGERPMDFSYFNAVLKSTTFPPYDPWFAGGYINYYYYGFVLVGMPVKLLGLVPTIAYNFILPTLFALTAMGAFCVAWNLLEGVRSSEGKRPAALPWIAGLLAAWLMVGLGNLGTLRMIYQGLQRLAAPGGVIDPAGVWQRLGWALDGLFRLVAGEHLPFGRGDWYWNPSRIIPAGLGNEITEFPFFTFLYSDLHAHMMALPLTLLALAWALALVKKRGFTWPSLCGGAWILGALYPANLSDMYTYLPFGLAALGYACLRAEEGRAGWRRFARAAGSMAFVIVLSRLLYQPYYAAYSQGYRALEPWTASHTPLWSYLSHWGVFLFIVTFWLAWETREWLASTPLSALNKLRPYRALIEVALLVFLALWLLLILQGVVVAWVVLPLTAWAGILLLRPSCTDARRFVLFSMGTALWITLMVEVVVVRGDIGRMNTVFKFYLQAWTLLSLSAAAAFAWILNDLSRWSLRWRNFFQTGATLLLAGAALYTVSATLDKVSDRMADGVPPTLDSITYMRYARYADFGGMMDLSYDYRAIRWMQDHVRGSPVIVEANCPEYRWCTRFTIYTGLPGVVGWNWHQRQQRTFTPYLVERRVDEVHAFYNTTDVQGALRFLRKYNVGYIVLGQLERLEYAGPGLDKFAQYDGLLWKSVYRDGDTVIYEVLQ